MKRTEPGSPADRNADRAVTGRPERRLAGIAISAGVGIGPVFGPSEDEALVARRPIAVTDMVAEVARLDGAVAQSRKQVEKLRTRIAALPQSGQTEIGPLLDAYLQMLGPSRLLRQARRQIADGLICAEAAVADGVDAIAVAMLAVGEGPDAARRADEVREIGRRLLRNLTGARFRSFAGLPPGALLTIQALRPADVVLLDPACLGGVLTEEGSVDGHTAVMLRALGVPAVLGVPGLLGTVRADDLAVIDGSTGAVILNPTPETLAIAQEQAADFQRDRQHLGRSRLLKAETADGEAVDLQANMELPGELPLILEVGAAGIGLLRSEFMFMAGTLPNEDEQTEAYRQVIAAMDGKPVTIRVLDWGGEKDGEQLPGEGGMTAANPALGLRGIRLLLQRMDLFETQLAAILRASVAGPTRILLPMITTVLEVRATRDAIDRVARRLRRHGTTLPNRLPQLGIMIETPGAALTADALALEADFFSIGTNDLTMYTMAVDRADTELAPLYDPLSPAVLRLVQFSAEAALRLRRPVSVCGEIAANPKLMPLLLGMGLRSFSMQAGALPRVKHAIRAVRIDECARFARRVLEQADPDRVRELVFGRS